MKFFCKVYVSSLHLFQSPASAWSAEGLDAHSQTGEKLILRRWGSIVWPHIWTRHTRRQLLALSHRRLERLLKTFQWSNAKRRHPCTSRPRHSSCTFLAESALASLRWAAEAHLHCSKFVSRVGFFLPSSSTQRSLLAPRPFVFASENSFSTDCRLFFSTWAAKLTTNQQTNNLSRFHGFCPHPTEAQDSHQHMS